MDSLGHLGMKTEVGNKTYIMSNIKSIDLPNVIC